MSLSSSPCGNHTEFHRRIDLASSVQQRFKPNDAQWSTSFPVNTHSHLEDGRTDGHTHTHTLISQKGQARAEPGLFAKGISQVAYAPEAPASMRLLPTQLEKFKPHVACSKLCVRVCTYSSKCAVRDFDRKECFCSLGSGVAVRAGNYQSDLQTLLLEGSSASWHPHRWIPSQGVPSSVLTVHVYTPQTSQKAKSEGELVRMLQSAAQ